MNIRRTSSELQLDSHLETPWLRHVIEQAVEKRQCMNLSCSTCGCGPFIDDVLRSAAERAGVMRQVGCSRVWSKPIQDALIEGLRQLCSPCESLEDGLRVIIYNLDRQIRDIDERLAGSELSSVLDRMRSYQRSLNEWSRLQRIRNDPQIISQLRAAKRSERQSKHEQRLSRKKVRDKWRSVLLVLLEAIDETLDKNFAGSAAGIALADARNYMQANNEFEQLVQQRKISIPDNTVIITQRAVNNAKRLQSIAAGKIFKPDGPNSPMYQLITNLIGTGNSWAYPGAD